MKKTVLLSLLSLSLLVLVVRFVVNPAMNLLGYKQKAGLNITTTPQSQVMIDGAEVGKTPYDNKELKPGPHQVKLISGKAVWQSQVNITPGTQTFINRELSEGVASSSGEVLTLTSGRGAIIASLPSGAQVLIDDTNYGQTPLSISNLSAGQHTFLISHDGYLKRSIRAWILNDFALNIVVDLAISEADLGFLSTTPVESLGTLVVKPTPTGFLRVRDSASLSGNEIERVVVGDTLTLLEDKGDWFKVKTSDGKEGYVASLYVAKKSQ